MNVNEKPMALPMETNDVLNHSSRNTAGSRQPRLRWLWILISLIILAAVIFVLSYVEDSAEVAQRTTLPPLPLVSVETIETLPQQVVIRSFAEIQPRWSAELTASVTGRVEQVFDAARAGEPVEAETKLIQIEDSKYVAALAAAEHAAKEAKFNLLQAGNATRLARDEFRRISSAPPSDLALKLPQLDIAKSAVISADAQVQAAMQQLSDTTIVAPFAAFVTRRFVSPGQSVNPGDRLIKLVDKSSFELAAEFGRDAWALLSKPLEGQTARLLNQEGEEIATATVRRGGGFLDEQTRQYRLFLQVKNPVNGNVLSGDFVTVQLDGIIVDRALDIPSSALTREGFVWVVDANDELQRVNPDVLFRRDERVIVNAPQAVDEWRVAVTPLASFLPGRKVDPQSAGK